MSKNRGLHIPVRQAPGQSNTLPALDQMLSRGDFAGVIATAEAQLRKNPRDAGLLHRLGVALIQTKVLDRARQVLEQAAALAPNDARLHNDLGIAYEKSDDAAGAERAYREALRLAPNLAEAHSNLADLLCRHDQPDEGIRHAEIAIQINPGNPLAWIALGEFKRMYGRVDETIAAFEKAVELKPPYAKAFVELARMYIVRRRMDEALALLHRALDLFDNDPKVLNDLGLTLGSMERYDEAQTCFETAYRLLQEPVTLFNVLTNLGHMRRFEQLFGMADEVLRHPQPNLALLPIFSSASGMCQWRLQDRLLPSFLEICAIEDRKASAAGPSLLMLLPIPAMTPDRIAKITEKVAATHRHQIRHYQVDLDHGRAMVPSPKLRIGYLSGDFRQHVVNYFISGQLSHYDKQYFEVYCYSSLKASVEDEITEQYRGAVDKFIRVEDDDDIELAKRIAQDGIQILIDLSGYTAGMRLGSMYLRPAPVQATYLGYPYTTGMTEVDFVLSDRWLNGPENARHYTETVLEIGHSFCASTGFPVEPEVTEPPCLRRGYVTFGSLNNGYKLNPLTVGVWSRILARVPSARLVINNPRYGELLTQEAVLKEFEAHGIGRERIMIVFGSHPKGRHFYWYEDLDIALDAFPQTGGTTTFEALWMGVPVVTLVGDVTYERLSYSIMENCGTEIEDLVAFSADEYVERAVALANAPARIAELHENLPRNMRQSLLCDPARHIRLYEDTLIEAWNRKFPQSPRFTPETFSYARLATPAAPLVATVADPGNLARYVVEEQGGWFAPEYALLERLGRCLGGLAVEVGAEPGFFSLELAQAGLNAVALCTSSVSGRLIRAAAERGGLAERVEVRLESAKTGLLDRNALQGVGLLRLGVEANDGAAGPVHKNPAFWAGQSPVVLVSLHGADQVDLSTVAELQTRGYGLYHLLPGLGFFEPHAPDAAIDPYALYLLACTPDKAAVLAQAGLLAEGPAQVAVAAIPEAVEQIDAWVVDCASRAHEPQRPAQERLAYLGLALDAQRMLVEHVPSTSRRLTLVRLLADMGRRAEALAQVGLALGEIEAGTASVSMPFLAPSVAWDAIAPGERLAEWLFAALIETRVRLGAHSTYFLPEQDLQALDILPALGFETAFSRGAARARQARMTAG